MDLPTPTNSSAKTEIKAVSRASIYSIIDPDILDQVIEHLAEKRHLAIAACTCKMLMDPALDRLWKSLDSLFPLFKILPAFQNSDGTYVLRGRVTEKDWSRFDWYARRVRTFSYTRDPDALDIAMHVYFRIAQLRNPPLLPELQHLHCPSLSQSDFLISAVCLFLSPSLQTVEFDNITGVEDKLVGTFLHTLMCDNAPLECINLRGQGLSKDTLNYVSRFHHLKKLHLSGMGDNTDLQLLQEIGNLGYLEDLIIDFSNSPLMSKSLDQDVGFTNLKHLTISASLQFIQVFLSRISIACHLTTLFIVAPADLSFQRREFVASIASRWSSSLRRFGLVHDSVDEVHEVISTTILSPLLSLKNMEHICIEGYTTALSDDDILTFATAWPRIKILLLPFIDSETQRPTMKSLQSLAVFCPRLIELRIPLDTNDVPLISSNMSSPRHGLENMVIASGGDPWDVRNLLDVARFIDYTFPCLDYVEAHDGRDGQRWGHVNDMIQMFQAVRSEAIALTRTK